ncbi:Carnitine O-acetyltransferase mitochondrial [Gonapodya sp. JEL0774]|nr:Carnitine O-acetyltransferase mitochondrial [Gonapodya sp. JEL0774]
MYTQHTFKNRADAGIRLSEKLMSSAALSSTPTSSVIVLALPRGGVPVAYPIAQRLGAPLDLYIVRKIGAPHNEELALGALAMDGTVVMNDDILRLLKVPQQVIDQTRAREEVELNRRNKRYRNGAPAPIVRGKTVVLVDDGIATGATIKSAALAIRRAECDSLILAVPVAAADTARAFRRDGIGNELVCVTEPKDLGGVGAFYDTPSRAMSTAAKVKVSYKETFVKMDPSKPLWAGQSKLPRLPVPKLQDTAAKYLKSVRPLLNDKEFAQTTKAVQDFIKPGGIGQELQTRLEKRGKEHPSWLADWWFSYAYMGYRDPIVINVSYFYVMRDDKARTNQVVRAASLVKGALAYRKLLNAGELEPEMQRGSAMDSRQYAFVFNACRVPKIPDDVCLSADPAQHEFIVVIRNNQFFKVPTVGTDGKELSAAELEIQLQRVVELAGSKKGPAVGVLVADNRDVWTKNYEALRAASPVNIESLDAIQTSIFVLCLDSDSPVTREECARSAWHGDAASRYYDKHSQIIVWENGKAAFMGEHSMIDATPTAKMFDWIADQTINNKIPRGTATSPVSVPTPTKLDFVLTPALNTAIAQAQKSFDELISKHDVAVLASYAYGKNLIKKMGVSPDALAQMAMQLAFFRMHGVGCATYETANTRKFDEGRTETVRTFSDASKAWTAAMVDPTIPVKIKGQLCRAAVDAHVAYMNDALEGHGVDRHLLGLRLILKPDEPKPEIFTDPTYTKSSHWRLSTSQIPNDYFEGYGWGEVVPDGYGIAYMIKNDSMHFNVASLKPMQPHRLKAHIEEALFDIRDILLATAPAPKAKI